MANLEHLAILKKSVDVWNRWRADHIEVSPDLQGISLPEAPLIQADLFGADFGSAHMPGAHFTGSDLKRACFRGAHLNGAHFGGAYLVEADFRQAYARGAHFRNADLRQVHFAGADLHGADLNNTRLCRAHLTEANLNWAKFADADLSEAVVGGTAFARVDLSSAKGLESLKHVGPSSVGIDTIYLSQGRIPEAFLRGAGVPDIFIAYARSLASQPIEFYSCFISYSTNDHIFAERLYTDLQDRGVRCWFSPHDVQAGRKIHEQIDEAIRLYDRLLLILSEHSMNSEWVKTEIAHARRKELNDNRQVLFPIGIVPFGTIREWKCFDGDTGKDSAREIREYFIPDFSNWIDHASYQKVLERLVRDLKA